MKCVDCGCYDHCACIGFDGEPCHWVTTNPPLCSTCADKRVIKEVVIELRARAAGISAQHTNAQGKWLAGRDKYKAVHVRCLRLVRGLRAISAKAGR